MFRTILKSLLALIVIIAGILTFGPREPVDEAVKFDSASLGSDLDAYLKAREANIPELIQGAEKQIIWNDPATKSKTPISIVYIHGFSATLEEIRPTPDLIAKELGANLFFTRLKGHGRDGDAMAEPTVNDWFNDTAEALAIGRALGDKVFVVSTSTGGTFTTWAASKPELIQDVGGLINVSPNYGVNNPASALLTLGAARYWVPLLVGAQRSFEPSNAEHAKWWTEQYPTVALLPMARSVEFVNTIKFEDITIPSLFIYHPEDKVVRADITKSIAGRWGKNTSASGQMHEIASSEDGHNHVIAGRIKSPSNSVPIAQKALEWIRTIQTK